MINCESPMMPCKDGSKEHPKLSDANLIERLAQEVERLAQRSRSLGERLEVLYMIDRIGRSDGGGCTIEDDFGTKLSLAYAKKRAEELRNEAEKELCEKQAENKVAAMHELHFPFLTDRYPLHPSDTFMNEMKELARDIEISADAAVAAKDPGTRRAFVFTLFNRLQAFQKRLAALDLRSPA